jgi:hypothetical protein
MTMISGNRIFGEVITAKEIKHLGLWDRKARSPTKVTGPLKITEYSIDYYTSQFPASYKWLYVDTKYPEVYSAN